MKVRKRSSDESSKVELDMTPMIDIVFQLLIFFIMTFKIVVQEGDFNVNMPAAAPSSSNSEPELPPICVRLTAGAGGELAGIRIGERPVASFADLRNEIVGMVGQSSSPSPLRETVEVELDCDRELHYGNVISAISAVSGYAKDGQIVKLIEKIKFAPPRNAK